MALAYLPSTLPFWLHLLIELPASLNFFLRPSEQLSSPAPQAHAVIKQYATLLLSSNLVALVFMFRPVDGTSANVAGALAIYHLAPLTRATLRLVNGDGGYGKQLGGPVAHMAVHGACFFGLAQVYAQHLLRN